MSCQIQILSFVLDGSAQVPNKQKTIKVDKNLAGFKDYIQKVNISSSPRLAHSSYSISLTVPVHPPQACVHWPNRLRNCSCRGGQLCGWLCYLSDPLKEREPRRQVSGAEVKNPDWGTCIL